MHDGFRPHGHHCTLEGCGIEDVHHDRRCACVLDRPRLVGKPGGAPHLVALCGEQENQGLPHRAGGARDEDGFVQSIVGSSRARRRNFMAFFSTLGKIGV